MTLYNLVILQEPAHSLRGTERKMRERKIEEERGFKKHMPGVIRGARWAGHDL